MAALMLGWLDQEVAKAQDLRPRTRQIYENDVRHVLEHIGRKPHHLGACACKSERLPRRPVETGRVDGDCEAGAEADSQAWSWGR
ncbi:MAG: hypothetical protein AAGA48_29120 [Myxococcota bacterium]